MNTDIHVDLASPCYVKSVKICFKRVHTHPLTQLSSCQSGSVNFEIVIKPVYIYICLYTYMYVHMYLFYICVCVYMYPHVSSHSSSSYLSNYLV